MSDLEKVKLAAAIIVFLLILYSLWKMKRESTLGFSKDSPTGKLLEELKKEKQKKPKP